MVLFVRRNIIKYKKAKKGLSIDEAIINTYLIDNVNYKPCRKLGYQERAGRLSCCCRTCCLSSEL